MWACLLPSRSSCHAAHSAFSQSPSFAVLLPFSDREGRPAHPADLYTPPHTVLHRSTSTRRTTLFDSLLSIFLSFCRVFSPRLFLVAPFVTHTLPFSFVSLARRERMKDRVPPSPASAPSDIAVRGTRQTLSHPPFSPLSPSVPPSGSRRLPLPPPVCAALQIDARVCRLALFFAAVLRSSTLSRKRWQDEDKKARRLENAKRTPHDL